MLLNETIKFVTEATQYCVHGGLQQITGSLAKKQKKIISTFLTVLTTRLQMNNSLHFQIYDTFSKSLIRFWHLNLIFDAKKLGGYSIVRLDSTFELSLL